MKEQLKEEKKITIRSIQITFYYSSVCIIKVLNYKINLYTSFYHYFQCILCQSTWKNTMNTESTIQLKLIGMLYKKHSWGRKDYHCCKY